MPHASDAQRLQALHAQLTAALASGDWRAVGEVDGAIRQCLEQLPRDPAADPAVQAARAQLRTLHGKALEACAEE